MDVRLDGHGAGGLRRRMGRGYWRGLVEEQERSGLSARAFCREREVALPSFYAWRGKLRRPAGGDGAAAAGFVELVEPPGAGGPGSGVSVVLAGGGTRIELGRGFCAEDLRRALAVLREAAR
jgi:hypothetical protein